MNMVYLKLCIKARNYCSSPTNARLSHAAGWQDLPCDDCLHQPESNPVE